MCVKCDYHACMNVSTRHTAPKYAILQRHFSSLRPAYRAKHSHEMCTWRKLRGARSPSTHNITHSAKSCNVFLAISALSSGIGIANGDSNMGMTSGQIQ